MTLKHKNQKTFGYLEFGYHRVFSKPKKNCDMSDPSEPKKPSVPKQEAPDASILQAESLGHLLTEKPCSPKEESSISTPPNKKAWTPFSKEARTPRAPNKIVYRTLPLPRTFPGSADTITQARKTTDTASRSKKTQSAQSSR